MCYSQNKKDNDYRNVSQFLKIYKDQIRLNKIFFLLHKQQNVENGFHIILICTDVSYNSQCICNNVDKCFILRTSQTSTSNLMCRSLQIVPHTTNL